MKLQLRYVEQYAVVLVTCLHLVCLASSRNINQRSKSTFPSSPASRGDTRGPEVVTIQERGQTWRPGGNTMSLPEHLDVTLEVERQSVQLHLEKNKHIDVDSIPVTFANRTRKMHGKSQRNVAYYQDSTANAVLAVTTTEEQGEVVHKYSGSFKMDKETYEIEPEVMNPVTSKSDLRLSEMQRKKKQSKHVIYKVPEAEGKTKYKVPPPSESVDYKTVTYTVNEEADSMNVTARERRNRQRRGATIASYHLELMFALDHTIWEMWLENANGDADDAVDLIKYYYGNIFNGMDMAYRSWDVDQWGFSVTLFLKEIYIAETPDESWWAVDSITDAGSTYSETVIDHDLVLEKMGQFVSQDGRNWSNPDHAMFWTRYDIDGNSAIGYAYVQGVCRGAQGVSIVEDTGFHSWSTGAHELGHSLGSYHDGDGNDCDPNDQYIMESGGEKVTEGTLANTRTFSNCSLRSFRELLDGTTDQKNGKSQYRDYNFRYPRVCLTNRVCEHGADTNVPDESDELPGERYTATEQCQLMHGEESYSCYDNEESICLILYCQSEYLGEENCWGRRPGAADGTPCGSNKWCIHGECVEKVVSAPASDVESTCEETSLPSDVPSGCTDRFGWYGRVNGVRQNCEQLAFNYPNFCMSWDAAVEGCCATCASYGLVEPTQHLVEPVDGRWSTWSAWSACSVTCQTGTQTRYRTCTEPAPRDGGSDCSGDDSQAQSCDQGSCTAPPVDGNWGSWGSWSACPVTCGTGIQYRERHCDDPEPSQGGVECEGSSEMSRTCDAGGCPVDGSWGRWTSWSSCSVTCGDGITTRSRECDSPKPQNGGQDCQGQKTDQATCEEEICRGTWASWESWGSCSVTCGSGTQSRYRQCIGKNCVGSGKKDRDCNPGDCPVHGSWGSWDSWTQCSVECGAGLQTRKRVCDNPVPANGGAPCPGNEQDEQFCTAGLCAVDGEWGLWSTWSACNPSCGPGVQSRTRDCDSPMPTNGGAACEGNSSDTQNCEGDCSGPWLPWEEWGACSVTCGGGTRQRSRKCEEEDLCTGQSAETDSCARQGCGDSSASLLNSGVLSSLVVCLLVLLILE